MYRKFWKRLLDILVAVLILTVFSPILLLTAIAVKADSKGPVFYRQTRLGKGAKPFEMYKFRSMKVDSEHTGMGVYSDSSDKRVTRVGRVLRATSIDELPQAVNILRGEMSLVGPRPPLTYHPWPVGQYTKEQMRMFEVRPGITGWAQTHGRRAVDWDERIRLNIWYVDHCSLAVDCRILLDTVRKVATNADNENLGETVRKTDR